MRWLIGTVLLMGVVGLWTATVTAETHTSVFGFQITLPTGWTVLDRGTIQGNPSAVEAALGTASHHMPHETLTALKEMLARGEIEYYIAKEPHLIIAASPSKGTLPSNHAGVMATCDAFPEELSKRVGKMVRIYECGLEKVAEWEALRLVADDHREGYRSIQYHIQKAPQEVVTFTVTGIAPSDIGATTQVLRSLLGTVTLRQSQ